MRICTREFNDEVIGRIAATVEAEPKISRRELSRRVCRWLDWTAPNGNLKDMSCRKALSKLNRIGAIRLPEPRGRDLFLPKGPIRRVEMPPGIEEISCSLQELGHVEVIPVQSGDKEASRLWNALMDRFHYMGSGPLCGAQIRYLVHSSEHRAIGGLAFSASAFHIAARDKWIGWTVQAREANLSRLLCNSRFLLVPRIPNLASHVLARCVQRIRDDWRDLYGIDPVLIETFVEKDIRRGTCYRAANWLHIGCTAGRGRMDRNRSNNVPVKDIYVFPLVRNARKLLCDGSDDAESLQAVKKASKKRVQTEDRIWAADEFGNAELGDFRLTKRLVSLAQDMYARPQANIPQACQNRAKAKAAYRFLEHGKVTMEKILQPHYQQTVERLAEYPVVLAVQDSTSLNYTAHPATENIGPIGGSEDGPIGLILHDTMAFNLEGTPLGLLDVQCWARDPEKFGKRRSRATTPIEQKESYKWLKSFRRAAWAQEQCPGTVVVSVGDREADLYDLFELALQDPKGPKLLVRAMQKRPLADEQGYVWDKVSKQDITSYLTIRVPRKGKEPPREADLEIRFAKVKLKPPDLKRNNPSLTVWAILAQETPQSARGKPIQWKLITTCPIDTAEQAVEKVVWYARRWGVEVYHRTLKSGCKIEERQLGSADRIETCLAVDMVVAWRIFHLTMLGRETPDVPCTVFFEEHEWKAVVAYWTKNPLPKETPTLGEATRMVAQLGGFLGRKCDGNPGTKSLWLGLQRMDDLASMYKFMVRFIVQPPDDPPVSSDIGYG
ncbi:MAG: IS4 family transposase [Pseudomonadota bacterium]